MPADGIYAGWYERPDGEVHGAAISLGRRPTFHRDADSSLLEPHLLDFEGDLYGEVARVRFVERLRSEQRFELPAGGDANYELTLSIPAVSGKCILKATVEPEGEDPPAPTVSRRWVTVGNE